MITVFADGQVFDGWSDALVPADVVVEGDTIVEVSPRARVSADRMVQLGGRTLLPGLIDAHVHVYAADLDLTRGMRRPRTYVAHYAARFLRHMLWSGFTTVRDCAGADHGLVQALNDGLLEGPRLFHGGRCLSQTGGHADWRPGGEEDPSHLACGCGVTNLGMAVVADGVDQVLQAVREEFRRGAKHIKIMGSGGVASPSDPLGYVQYSPAEITAAVEEAERHGSYVAAHCHPASAVARCAEAGVRTIEHATMIDAAAAAIVARRDAFVVPTMAVIDAFRRRGAELGLPPASVAKLGEIVEPAKRSLQIMRDARLKIGFGTDLLGPVHTENLNEFDLRREVFTPAEILRQATSVNAAILKMDGRLGCIAPGALADLVVVDRDPLADIGVMTRGVEGMPVVVKGGAFVRNALG